MSKARIIVLIVVSGVSIVSSVHIHREGQAKLHAHAKTLKHLQEQTVTLQESNRSKPIPGQSLTTNTSAAEQRRELRSLRQESRTIERRIGSLKAELEKSRKPSYVESELILAADAGLFLPPTGAHSPNQLQELERAAVNRSEMRHLTSAVRQYARKNDGVHPISLEEALPYLWEDRKIPEMEKYELVFQGTTDELDGIPPSAIALVRERIPWIAPSGKLARMYGMLGGNIEVVESDDNFVAWEARHVVPPSP